MMSILSLTSIGKLLSFVFMAIAPIVLIIASAVSLKDFLEDRKELREIKRHETKYD